jgi:hypothetical protein
MPSSLVLGGYDQKRFVPHDVEFTLTRETALPQALVRGIEVSIPEKSKPDWWDSNRRVLSDMNSSFEAIIDSSTPFLWLPESVCSNFAEAFNLTYRTEFGAYLVNDTFDLLRADDSFSFTFSLSSYDNNDDFGQPLDVPGVVNITLSAYAFAQVLKYPFNNMAIEYKAKSVPYFPIKVAPNDTFILGRTFLQEAYLLTKYDSTVFSVHQALFPDSLDTEIKAVEQPPNSPYPPPLDTGDKHGLSKNQMIGIVAGVVVATLIALFIFCFCCRRRRKRTRMPKTFLEEGDTKDTSSSILTETPKTPVSRIFSKIIRRKRSRKNESVEASGTETNPAEVGADATHELYELPAPLPPVELDADTHSIMSETELGTEGSENLSAYEIARRKMERRLQGPVPAYSPPVEGTAASGAEASTGDKTMQDVSPVETYRPADRVSPASSPTYANTDSLPRSLPSPMSPRGDWTENGDMPSPMTIPPSFPSPIYAGATGRSGTVSSHDHTRDASSLSRSSSANDISPISPSSTSSSLGKIQRTPIDPTKIICLGPLPENVQLPIPSPSRSTIPRTPGPESQSPGLPVMSNQDARVSTDTLGSNFTDVEERLAQEPPNQRSSGRNNGPPVSPLQPTHHEPRSHNLESPRSLERIDAGAELVHVPQLAERRYSWEEDR